jgi:hypothetical protein
MLARDERTDEREGVARMAEQEPDRPDKGGYGRNWGKYLLIYLIAGGIVYLLVWLLFFRDGGLYG